MVFYVILTCLIVSSEAGASGPSRPKCFMVPFSDDEEHHVNKSEALGRDEEGGRVP